MIFDQQNIFLDNAAHSAASNVIANVGGGDAADPLFLVASAGTALTTSGTITLSLQTCDAEGFGSGVVTLASYTLPASVKGLLVKAKIPYGAKKFLKVAVSGATGGKLTVGLTETVPNWP